MGRLNDYTAPAEAGKLPERRIKDGWHKRRMPIGPGPEWGDREEGEGGVSEVGTLPNRSSNDWQSCDG